MLGLRLWKEQPTKVGSGHELFPSEHTRALHSFNSQIASETESEPTWTSNESRYLIEIDRFIDLVVPLPALYSRLSHCATLGGDQGPVMEEDIDQQSTALQPDVADILVVDDHPITRAGLIAILQTERCYRVCGECGTAREAVDMFRQFRPAITLLDLNLPDGYGVEVIRDIRRIDPKARILVITTYEGDEDIHRSLQAGAMGYLVKGVSHEVIFRALRKIQRGCVFLPEPVSRTLQSRSNEQLTERERQVLSLMVAGKSNREIGDALNIKEVSVKSHITLILSRLQVSDRTQAVVAALKRGLEHL
jgi:DNA-binding NarL/FixJ family response regulator